jgi:integrase/recombinase XerD
MLNPFAEPWRQLSHGTAPAGNVIVLAGGSGARGPATVNRHLAGVFGFYDHHARTGLGVAAELVSWRRISRGSYKPFLHHVTKGRPIPVRPVKLHVPRHAPRTLEPEQIVAILAACEHLRDRFLLSLLAETGMRAGQALGLRHADFVSRRREVHIVPRADNANRARAKLRSAAVVPVSAPLVRLYSEYMHAEYGDTDSDYVFVNLFGGRIGAAMTYPAVNQLIGRIAARTGISFTAHMLRHSHATAMVRRGVPVEVVARLLTHRSPVTTSQTYVHLDTADVREALRRAGVWQAKEDQ